MTPEALTLFDAVPTRGASRTSDPWVSRIAGRSMTGTVLRHQQALVLAAVAHLGTATAWEVHSRVCTLVQQSVVSKRLGELAVLGMVRLTGETRPGSSHRPQLVYECTAAGREAL